MRTDLRLTRRAPLGLVLGLLLVFVALLAGCTRTPSSAADSVPTGEPSNGPGAAQIGTQGVERSDGFASVAMIGDSITDGSSVALDAALRAAGFRDVTIDAQVSRRIEIGGGPGEPRSGTQAMESLLASGVDPDVWVIALGTNDVGKYAEDDYAAVVHALLDMVPAGDPLVWVDVHVTARPEDTEDFNALLRDLIDERGNAVVASWSDAVTGGDVLRDDGLHPNQRGTQVFADLVVDALEDVD